MQKISIKWQLRVLQGINAYAAESGLAPAVCVVGHRVARIFSMIYDTHHRWGCVYVNLTKVTVLLLWLLCFMWLSSCYSLIMVLVLVQPLKFAYLPSPPYLPSTLSGRMGKLKAIDNTASTSNVHIFWFNSHRNYLSDAPEFYVQITGSYFASCLCLISSTHCYFSLLFWFIRLQIQLLSLSGIQKQMVTIQHMIPEPQFCWCL